VATIEKLCAPGVYDPPGYNQVIKVTDARAIVFLAGQVPYDTDGGVTHRGDVTGQARRVFGAVKAHVEAAGGTLRDVVKITSYVTDVRRGSPHGRARPAAARSGTCSTSTRPPAASRVASRRPC
jgi:enamine deaminase RidA (YjgF/YER057c/UK114 family)